MYEKHFSFKYRPFELIPNPDFLFYSSTHKKAATYLDYGIKEKVGFILLTGEIGSGKTTIVRNLIKNLNGSVKLSRINNTMVTSEELISMINEDFGLEVDGKNKVRLLSELNKFLIDQYSRQAQPILLIDEAQNLSAELLEEVRLLSNLETDKAKLLQIILIGQPELKKTLMCHELMQLRQRININYHISSLTVEETEKYIKHRLTVAGNQDAFRFEDDMLAHIFRFSRGIPRLINILCDFALLNAFVDDMKEVTADVIREVVDDLESRDYWNESRDSIRPGPAANSEDTGLLKTAEKMALRLFELEEKIRSSSKEFESLSERINGIEEAVSRINRAAEDSALKELSERISRLERNPNDE